MEEHVEVSAPEPVSPELKLMQFSAASGWGQPIPPGEVLGPYKYLPASVISETNYDGCEMWEGTPFEGKTAVISR